MFFSCCACKKSISILDIKTESVINISFLNRGIDSFPQTISFYKKVHIEKIINSIRNSKKVFKPRVNINYGLMECIVSCDSEIKFLIIKTEYDGVILRYEDNLLKPHYYRNDSLLNLIKLRDIKSR
jgi:hypothetical protein